MDFFEPPFQARGLGISLAMMEGVVMEGGCPREFQSWSRGKAKLILLMILFQGGLLACGSETQSSSKLSATEALALGDWQLQSLGSQNFSSDDSGLLRVVKDTQALPSREVLGIVAQVQEEKIWAIDPSQWGGSDERIFVDYETGSAALRVFESLRRGAVFRVEEGLLVVESRAFAEALVFRRISN